MSHAMGVICPTCKAVTQPDICPEGCGSHGSSYIECGVCRERGDGMTPDRAALRALHYDYDSDGHSDECGERRPCATRSLLAALDAAEAEVARLTALVHAKEAWIDGAKVDLEGLESEVEQLRDAQTRKP